MGISTVFVGAAAAKEMNAQGDTVRSGVMGKVTLLTSCACAVAQELLTDGDLVDVMSVRATVAEGADACFER